MNISCNNRSCFISSSTQVQEAWRVAHLCARWPCWMAAGWSRCTLSLWARRTSSPCNCSLGGRTADRAGLWWWRTDSRYSESCCLPLPPCPSALWRTQEVKTQVNNTWSGDSMWHYVSSRMFKNFMFDRVVTFWGDLRWWRLRWINIALFYFVYVFCTVHLQHTC